MKKGQTRKDKDFIIREKIRLLQDFCVVTNQNRQNYIEKFEKAINNKLPYESIESVANRLTMTIISESM
jgi:hypothetical protein